MNDIQDIKLSKLRTQIDEVDSELLKLFSRRADLVSEVGALKKNTERLRHFIRSARETNMMKDILNKGAGKFPKRALFSIWRNIICASLQLEGGLKVVVLRGKNFGFDKLVVEYFGSFSDYALCDTINAAYRTMDDYSVGVFTLSDNWWEKLPSDVKVFAKLHNEVFAVAKIRPEEAGGDKTLIFSETEIEGAVELAKNLYELDGFHEVHVQGKVLGNYA